jgi:lysophospholipase L1-like esterase
MKRAETVLKFAAVVLMLTSIVFISCKRKDHLAPYEYPTPTATHTGTTIFSATFTHTGTATATRTFTPVNTNTSTIAATATHTATNTITTGGPTLTFTNTATRTFTPTQTGTATWTNTATNTVPAATNTFTNTRTSTATATRTPTTGPTAAYTPNDADDPNILYIGRWERSNPKSPANGWGATGIRTSFQGTSAAVKLSANGIYFSYRVDSGTWKTLTATAATSYTVATGLADTTHTFELYRRNEGISGTAIFNGFTLDAGKVLVNPGPRPSRKMLFIGDSITAGYGCECVYSNTCGSGNTVQNINGNQSWAPRLARLFNADYQVVAQSGAGVYMNAAGSLTDIMPTYYQQTYRNSSNPQWNDGYWENPSVPGGTADVVAVMLGTNDFSTYGKAIVPTETQWKTAMNAFIDTLHADHPNAHIFIISTFYATGNFANVITWNNAIVSDRGVAWLHALHPAQGTPWINITPNTADYTNSDVMGDWTHPLCHDDVHGDFKIAQRAYQAIQPVMGW